MDKFINTLVKMGAGKGRILNDGQSSPVPLTDATRPKHAPDALGLSGYRRNAWLEGAEWAPGGVRLETVNRTVVAALDGRTV